MPRSSGCPIAVGCVRGQVGQGFERLCLMSNVYLPVAEGLDQMISKGPFQSKPVYSSVPRDGNKIHHLWVRPWAKNFICVCGGKLLSMVTSFPAVYLNTPEKEQQDRGMGEAGQRCRFRSQFSFVCIVTVRRGRYKRVAPAESGPCLRCALDTHSRQGFTAAAAQKSSCSSPSCRFLLTKDHLGNHRIKNCLWIYHFLSSYSLRWAWTVCWSVSSSIKLSFWCRDEMQAAMIEAVLTGWLTPSEDAV